MFYNLKELSFAHPEIKNIASYANYEVKTGRFVRLKRDLYTDNPKEDPLLIGCFLCRPSYVSFQYALSYYGLIPERVFAYTMATTGLRRRKTIENRFGRFLYRCIPSEVYPWGLVSNEEGFLMATPEKALCDLLHIYPGVRNEKDLISLLFEDLRIDIDEFDHLSAEDLLFLCDRYPGDTFRVLKSFIEKRRKNESHSL